MVVSFVWRLITIRELSWVLKKNLIVIRELIVALYVWFRYLKIYQRRNQSPYVEKGTTLHMLTTHLLVRIYRIGANKISADQR